MLINTLVVVRGLAVQHPQWAGNTFSKEKQVNATMNGHLCVAAIAAFLVAPNLAIDCGQNRCLPKAHTLCKYPNPKPAPACGSVLSTGFTEVGKKNFLYHHNKWRQMVAAGQARTGNPGPQPAAYSMPLMFWDNELAEIAQRWANQCSVGHDECRDVDRFAVGQNYALAGPYGDQLPTPEDIFMMWYKEVDNMDKKQLKKLTTVERVANYTQIVWAATKKIGCGMIVFRPDKWKWFYLVCNYGPAGNQFGKTVYEAVPPDVFDRENIE